MFMLYVQALVSVHFFTFLHLQNISFEIFEFSSFLEREENILITF